MDHAIKENALVITVHNRYQELRDAWKEVIEKHEKYVNELSDSDEKEEDCWMSELSEVLEEIEIRTDKYLDKAHNRDEKDEMERKVQVESEKEETRQKEVQLKLVKELLIKRDQEGMKFYKSVDTTEKLLKIEAEAIPNHVAVALGSALDRLDEIKNKCDKAQIEYIAAITNSGQDVTSEQKNWIVKIVEVYNGICDECRVYISLHEKKFELSSVPESSEGGAIRLEKLKFEPFSGELRKYPRFKEEFLKHVKPRYKPHEEAFVLKSYLATDIKEDVNNLGDDATEIWRRLDRKYNDKSKMVDSIMAEIKQLTASANEDPTETLHMIKVIERAHRDLKSLGLEKKISNSTIVSMIEEKLPQEIEKEWIKIVTG